MPRGPDGGPLIPVKVELADFHSVAEDFVKAQSDLVTIRDNLLRSLDAANGAAGACDGAHQFQDSFAAAMDVLVSGGFGTAHDLLGDIGLGIDVSALNHWQADNDSTPGSTASPPWTQVTPHVWQPNNDVVNLVGSSPWWVPGFLEKDIPTADDGSLDAAAQACRDAAGAVGGLVSQMHTALFSLLGSNTSSDLNDLEQFWDTVAGDHAIFGGLQKALNDIADSLSGFRAWNDDTQNQIKDKIKQVVEDAGAVGAIVGIAFVVGSIVTDGGLDALLAGIVELLGPSAEGAIAAPVTEVAVAAAGTLLVGAGAIAIARSIGPMMQAAMSGTPKPQIEQANASKVADELGQAADDTGLRPDDPLPTHADGRPLSTSEAKSVRSLEQNIAEHEQKLADYERDPYAYDNKGILKNAPNDAVRQQIIQGRIRHLETEINTFRENIQKIIGG